MSFASELRQVQEPSHAPHPWPSPTHVPDASDNQASSVANLVPTRHPFAKSFACAGVVCMVTTSLMTFFATHYVPPDAMPFDRLDTTMAALLWFAMTGAWLAVITGLIVSCSERVWPLWSIALTFLAMYLLVIIVPVVGVASLL